MIVAITVEGFTVRGSAVPKRKLFSLWRTLTDTRFPRVVAFQLEEKDFEYIIASRRCREDELREMQEWGRILSTRGTDACVFNADGYSDAEYVILVRENPYHLLDEVLRHELSHILRGDL